MKSVNKITRAITVVAILSSIVGGQLACSSPESVPKTSYEVIQPFQITLSASELDAILSDVENIIFNNKDNPNPIASDINAILEDTEPGASLEDLVTFKTERSEMAGHITSLTEEINVYLPKTSPWLEGLLSYGVPKRLETSRHELYHLIQIRNIDPEVLRHEKFLNDYEFALTLFTHDVVGEAIAILQFKNQKRDVRPYFGGNIFYDTSMTEDDALDFLTKYNEEFELGLKTPAEIENVLFPKLQRLKLANQEGSVIREAQAYFASSILVRLNDLPTAIKKSTDSLNSNDSLDTIKDVLQLVGKLYSNLDALGYGGIAADIEAAKIVGETFTGTDTQSPFNVFKARIDEMPQGIISPEEIYERKNERYEPHRIRVNTTFRNELKKRFGLDINKKYNLETIKDEPRQLYQFTFSPINN